MVLLPVALHHGCWGCCAGSDVPVACMSQLLYFDASDPRTFRISRFRLKSFQASILYAMQIGRCYQESCTLMSRKREPCFLMYTAQLKSVVDALSNVRVDSKQEIPCIACSMPS